MRILLALAAWLGISSALADDPSSARADLDRLRNEALEIALDTMREQNALQPFGAAIMPTGQIALIVLRPEHAGGTYQQQTDRIIKELDDTVDQRGFIATAAIYITDGPPPDYRADQQAIIAVLEHQTGLNEFAYVPFRRTDDGPVFEDWIITEGVNRFFPPRE